jgi:hypothetical protein
LIIPGFNYNSDFDFGCPGCSAQPGCSTSTTSCLTNGDTSKLVCTAAAAGYTLLNGIASPNTLVASWDPKSYTSGTAWSDSTGNGHTATLYGSPKFVAATPSTTGYFEFNGVNQWADVLDSPKIYPDTQKLTVAVWVYTIGSGALYSNNPYCKESDYEISVGGGFISHAWAPNWAWLVAQSMLLMRSFASSLGLVCACIHVGWGTLPLISTNGILSCWWLRVFDCSLWLPVNRKRQSDLFDNPM